MAGPGPGTEEEAGQQYGGGKPEELGLGGGTPCLPSGGSSGEGRFMVPVMGTPEVCTLGKSCGEDWGLDGRPWLWGLWGGGVWRKGRYVARQGGGTAFCGTHGKLPLELACHSWWAPRLWAHTAPSARSHPYPIRSLLGGWEAGSRLLW